MATQPIMPGTVQLQFNDGASCKRWIESLPLTNVQSAQNALTQQIALVRQAGIAPAELLRVLEALREPVAYVQHELARKYTGRPLPLETSETALWTRTLGLWQELIDGYLACRDAHVQGDPGLKNHGALVVMRCLRYTSCAMFEHYRIYRQVPAELWRKLHQLYVFAEQSGFARATVANTFNHEETDSSCAAAYCRALLAQLANPFAMSGRQMEFLERWIEKWSGLASLASQPLPPSAIPVLAIDLAGGAGPVFAEGLEPLTSLRYLDLEQIGRTLRQVITLLKQGQTPAQLGLGEDARQPGCENLLMLLYIQWCRAGTGRGELRDPTEEKAQVCLGMHAAHFYISGRAFRAPGASLSRQEEHDMQLFGHISERTERSLASSESSAVESWQLINQSNSGFMCMLREPDAQMRIGHNQLVAVRRGTSKLFYLGLVQWLRVGENNELFVGVRLFPGIARAVAMKPANFNAPSGIKGFERGLLLPELPAPSTPATLILPTGWYQPGRFVELHGEQKQVAKLVNLLEKGSDFERCTVTTAV
ncbi:MAG: hypothetical protein HY525_18040 [Betaproteobacteria bacterium]|nr:hypothetical protein [Betaproteobacteria bacterium]